MTEEITLIVHQSNETVVGITPNSPDVIGGPWAVKSQFSTTTIRLGVTANPMTPHSATNESGKPALTNTYQADQGRKIVAILRTKPGARSS